jgi:tetratricopeptide (TPR) repeat protein
VRNELRTLPDGLALRVARHLAASGEMINVDPELAWQHARAALNKASRVGIVREAAAEAAYNAGHFAEALTEFRAARRMRGIKEYWPLMADCERALGRPAKAISMAADPLVNSLDRASKVEMRIVASGARVDQGKLEAALATLQCPELTTTSNEAWSARIRYAYADVLEKLGRKDEALEWFHRAAAADAAEQTDADERIAALEGLVYQDVAEFDDEDDFAEDEVFHTRNLYQLFHTHFFLSVTRCIFTCMQLIAFKRSVYVAKQISINWPSLFNWGRSRTTKWRQIN